MLVNTSKLGSYQGQIRLSFPWAWHSSGPACLDVFVFWLAKILCQNLVKERFFYFNCSVDFQKEDSNTSNISHVCYAMEMLPQNNMVRHGKGYTRYERTRCQVVISLELLGQATKYSTHLDIKLSDGAEF